MFDKSANWSRSLEISSSVVSIASSTIHFALAGELKSAGHKNKDNMIRAMNSGRQRELLIDRFDDMGVSSSWATARIFRTSRPMISRFAILECAAVISWGFSRQKAILWQVWIDVRLIGWRKDEIQKLISLLKGKTYNPLEGYSKKQKRLIYQDIGNPKFQVDGYRFSEIHEQDYCEMSSAVVQLTSMHSPFVAFANFLLELRQVDGITLL